MAENLVGKILKDHMVEGSLDPGEEVGLRIDQTLLQDATGTMACMQFERMGVDRAQVDFAVQYIDHNVIQLDFKNPDDHASCRPSPPNTASTTPVRETASATICTSSGSPGQARLSSGRILIPPHPVLSGR